MTLLTSADDTPNHHKARLNRTHRGRHVEDSAGSEITGLWTLLRLMGRRDRWRAPIWILSLAALTAYFANAIAVVMDDDTLASMVVFAKNPVMGLITGPGYGMDEITIARFVVGMYGVFLMLGIAMMSITTMTRHTRAEEQTGRAELIRANVTGRHTQLLAALTLTLVMNLVAGFLMSLAFFFSEAKPEPFFSALLFGASIAAAGCVFAAITGVTAQLTSFARAASGIAGAVLAAAFVVRGLGDMSAVSGGDLDWLSWLSPLGWSQQTAPYTLDRWTPLLLSVMTVAVLIPVSLFLQSRRDLSAGIFADRLGRAHASSGLSTSTGLALRLQRSSLTWWSVGVFTMAVVFGSFTGAMEDGAAGMPKEILDLMGGSRGIVDGYIGYMALYFAMIVAAYAIIATSGLRAEEAGFRTEPVLATAVGRGRWVLSWTLVTLLGSLWLMALAGVGEGLGAAASTGDWSLMWPAVVGHVAQTASVWVLLGLALALYGFAPRLQGLVWIVFIVGAGMALFGQMMRLDDAVLDTSVFVHIGQYPAQDLSAEAVVALTVAAVVLIGVGMLGFRRRDLVTA
ncbi:MAG: ABC transporter permease [Brevibacterium sp.]|nr:ABC transporter permease [Brevibacterium sp.]MDN6175219.1 ABC transporter permease [Brevibacterium sp.]MDN6188966.1 ABC transporter permease [Brevibacterium sp.]MDN6191619.1 ABC transporter permease [Brevibacterium sp.]MDN6665789.1 ABC transporter permease [Brevibacterium sp.]